MQVDSSKLDTGVIDEQDVEGLLGPYNGQDGAPMMKYPRSHLKILGKWRYRTAKWEVSSARTTKSTEISTRNKIRFLMASNPGILTAS